MTSHLVRAPPAAFWLASFCDRQIQANTVKSGLGRELAPVTVARARYGERRAAFPPSFPPLYLPRFLAVLRRGENRFPSSFAYFYRRGLTLTDLVSDRAERYMKIYHFPPITLSQLVRESVSGLYSRKN